MRTYIYCPRKSTGAMDLVNAMGATRLRRFDGLHFWDKKRRIEPEKGSLIVCWGHTLPELDGYHLLNWREKITSKLGENRALINNKVPTVSVMEYDPRQNLNYYEQRGFVGRTKHHTGGLDLLNPKVRPDFLVQKVNIVEEYRIHSFAGRSIRAGVKVLRNGFVNDTSRSWTMGGNVAHPWIRSYDGGWRIKYDKFESTGQMRELAHKAVKALGLTFGAVDMGRMDNGNLIVLEVNTAPGLEGGTIQAYVRAINRWIKENIKE